MNSSNNVLKNPISFFNQNDIGVNSEIDTEAFISSDNRKQVLFSDRLEMLKFSKIHFNNLYIYYVIKHYSILQKLYNFLNYISQLHGFLVVFLEYLTVW